MFCDFINGKIDELIVDKDDPVDMSLKKPCLLIGVLISQCAKTVGEAVLN